MVEGLGSKRQLFNFSTVAKLLINLVDETSCWSRIRSAQGTQCRFQSWGWGIIKTRKGCILRGLGAYYIRKILKFRYSEMARNAFRILCFNNNSVIITVIH